MLTVPAFTDHGRRLQVGVTFNAGTREVGPDILPVDAKKYKEDLLTYLLEYREIRNSRELREFVGVSPDLSLQIKAGLVQVNGQGLCLKELTLRPDAAHVLIRLRCLTYQEYIRPADHVYATYTSAEGLGTHFVRATTQGGYLLICLEVHGWTRLRREQISGRAKGSLPKTSTSFVGGRLALELELSSLLQRLSDAGNIRVTCYSSTAFHQGVKTLEEVVDLLETFPGTLEDRGTEIIEAELQPLTILRIEGAPRYHDKQTLRPLLPRFEEQFDDMRAAQAHIDTFYCSGEELTAEGTEQLLTLSEQLRALMTSYEEVIGQLDYDVSLKVKDSFMKVMREYNTQGSAPRESDGYCFTRQASRILNKHVVDYKMSDYEVIDAAAWKEYRKRGWSVQQIKQEDLREKCRIERMDRQYTLKVNKCKSQQYRQQELRIVLLGKTGVGKSATGNTIVGDRKTFNADSCAHSVTQTIQESTLLVGDRRIRLLDTPGLFDTDRDKRAIDFELAKVLSEFCDGVHAFVYVINLASHRFTAEEQAAIVEVKQIFGEELMMYTVIVLTHADAVLTDKSLQAYIEELPVGPLRDVIVSDARMRVMAINNHFRLRVEQERQRDALLELVDLIQEEQKGECYSNAMFQRAKQLRSQKDRHSDRLKRNTCELECQRYETSALRVRDVCRQITREEFMTKTVSQIERDQTMDFRHVVTKVTDRVRSLLRRTEQECLSYLDTIVMADGKKTIDQIALEEIAAAAMEYKQDKRRRAALQSMRDYVELVLKRHAIDLHTEHFNSVQAISAVRTRLPTHLSNYIQDADIEREIQVQMGSNTIKNTIENKIKSLTDELHEVVQQKVEDYVQVKTMREMEAVAQKGFRATVQEVTGEVQEALSKESLSYFSTETLNETIVNYVKENQEHLLRLAAQQYFCFPAEGVVTTHNGTRAMSSLMTGDEVLTFSTSTGELGYEAVVMFSHADQDAFAPYVGIESGCGSTLFLSAQHLLPVGTLGRLKLAGEVTPGDTIFMSPGMEPSQRHQRLFADTVRHVSRCGKTGAYCPHTGSGSIIVNGIAASCHTSVLSPRVAQLALLPVRLLHKMLPLQWFVALLAYTETGIPALLNRIKACFIQ